MEIDNKIYQEAMEVLRTKLSNTSIIEKLGGTLNK